ncbi:MAG: hypothetical protein N2Z71_07250 [Caloramator sp.]|nr:hypothetical protein [Caloramator sp.]
MKNKIIKFLVLFFCILVIVAVFIRFLKTKDTLICNKERADTYRVRIVDNKGNPIKNKLVKVEQLTTDFMITSKYGFDNFMWCESINPKITYYENKLNLTPEIIEKEFGLERLSKEKNLKMHIDLRIPIGFKEKADIKEYEKIEMYALEQYAKAFSKYSIKPDYVHILAEFNQKMYIVMKFDKKDAIAFSCRYIEKARELFKGSKIVVDLGPIYNYKDAWYPVKDYHELLVGNVITHTEYVQELIKNGCDFDAIGIEYQPASHHSAEPKHIKRFFDDLKKFNKPIFIWEFWVPSDTPVSEKHPLYSMFINNKPKSGWNENTQAEIMKFMLNYIDSDRKIIGLTHFGWRDEKADLDKDIGYFGLIRIDGSKKPSYYVMESWYKSLFINLQVKTDENGEIHFKGMPGKYKFSTSFIKSKTIYLDGKNTDIQIDF